jgi:hypothetical protein
VFHVDTNELLDVIRTQVHLIREPGPVAEAVIRKILAAAEEYSKRQESMAQVCLAYDTPSRVEKLIGRRPGDAFYFRDKRQFGEFCEGLRGDLEPARELARRKA